MPTAPIIERRRITVQGIVQGVGFRPFVYSQALQCGLAGFVRNDSSGVTIEIEGEQNALEMFLRVLREAPPPLARIDTLLAEPISPTGTTSFEISQSQAAALRNTLIAPDSTTCDDCLRELFDPTDRRYGYPFINCTNCGPRFTIVQDVPYDRDLTTMRAFAMCPDCRAEYENPLDRRFHAQPNACPACGPQLDFRVQIADDRLQEALHKLPTAVPLYAAAMALAHGLIVAIKGLGGYHLACDARNAAAVARLRAQKQREARPFALMLPDLATAQECCLVHASEAALLQSRQRPIVLLNQRPDCQLAPGIAPGYTTLGVMLPYTPLHHLLLRAFADASPAGQPVALVMTSGNLSDEPIAYQDADAATRLATIADAVLSHNRDIHMRCDDSLVQVVQATPALALPQFLRRSRGYAPAPIQLAQPFARPVLACGGQLKNTFCLGKGHQAFISHHIGDLANLETLSAFRQGIGHVQRLFDIEPEIIAYDLHPEYLATKEAFAIAEGRGPKAIQTQHMASVSTGDWQLVGVQHHHAHIASVLAEHGLTGPVIGIAADGTGYGTDGAIWGCEVLQADLCGFTRLAHLAYVPLPGGEQAVRQPWRVAAAYLQLAFGDSFVELEVPFTRRLDQARWRTLAQMIARGLNCPPASSLGRLFDAVAALVGVRGEVLYEGQAAIELEAQAVDDGGSYPHLISPGQPAQIDVRPLFQAIIADLRQNVPASLIAGRFHRTIARLLAAACGYARQQTGLNSVALSGGVFQNRRLLHLLLPELAQLEFEVYLNRLVPPNDGGLSLGQAAIASSQLQIADCRL